MLSFEKLESYAFNARTTVSEYADKANIKFDELKNSVINSTFFGSERLLRALDSINVPGVKLKEVGEYCENTAIDAFVPESANKRLDRADTASIQKRAGIVAFVSLSVLSAGFILPKTLIALPFIAATMALGVNSLSHDTSVAKIKKLAIMALGLAVTYVAFSLMVKVSFVATMTLGVVGLLAAHDLIKAAKNAKKESPAAAVVEEGDTAAAAEQEGKIAAGIESKAAAPVESKAAAPVESKEAVVEDVKPKRIPKVLVPGSFMDFVSHLPENKLVEGTVLPKVVYFTSVLFNQI